MKHLTSLILCVLLSSAFLFPAFAEETQPEIPETLVVQEYETFEHTDARTALGLTGTTSLSALLEKLLSLLPDFDIGYLAGQVGDDTVAGLVNALWDALLGGQAGSEQSLDDRRAVVHDREPYTVTKTAVYRDKNEDREYDLTLTGYFVNVGGKPKCLRAETSYGVRNAGRWRITPGTVEIDGDKATCRFTVERLFTGVPVKTEEIELTVAGKPTGTVVRVPALRGDLNFDAHITAADARIALRLAVGLEVANIALLQRADVDCDGNVTAADARLILRAAVGL